MILLPLKIVAPAFVAATGAKKRKAGKEMTQELPDFFGPSAGTVPAAAPAEPAPAQTPVQEAPAAPVEAPAAEAPAEGAAPEPAPVPVADAAPLALVAAPAPRPRSPRSHKISVNSSSSRQERLDAQ